MQTRAQLYDRISTLFAYPPPGYRAAIEDVQEAFERTCPEAAGEMAAFARELSEMETTRLEELFTRTFDLNPECCCEVGWHLFGERYERGSFMVWMRNQLRRYEVPETGELPDHLVHVLRVLGRMDPEEARRFAADAVIPTLHRMTDSIQDKNHPFLHLLKAVSLQLVTDFGNPTIRREGKLQEATVSPAAIQETKE